VETTQVSKGDSSLHENNPRIKEYQGTLDRTEKSRTREKGKGCERKRDLSLDPTISQGVPLSFRRGRVALF